jgi:hypothetical protein
MMKIKSFFKNLAWAVLRWLQLWDAIWTLPLMIAAIVWISRWLVEQYGPAVGVFPPGLLNAGLLAAFYLLTGTTVVNIIIFFGHRGWFKIYYSRKLKDTRKYLLTHLPPWLQLLFVPLYGAFLLVLFCCLVAALI